MKTNRIARSFGALLVAVSLTLLATPVLAAPAATSTVKTIDTVLTAGINPSDQPAIDSVTAAKSDYSAKLATLEAQIPGSKEAKAAYKVASKSWKSLQKVQSSAKKAIGKTFKAAVNNANAVFKAAVKAGVTAAAKAEAKAAKVSAIAAASTARNSALSAIKIDLAKPVKPTK